MKKWIKGAIIFLIFFIVAIGVYYSPIGNSFLKNYVKEKLCFVKNFKIIYFNHSLNAFSMNLKNEKGFIQIFGTFFPFDASFNVNLKDLNVFCPILKGIFNATGEIFTKDDLKFVKGNFIYSKGFGKFNLKCKNKKISGIINGEEFDTKILLENIKNFKLPFFNYIPFTGNTDLKVTISNDIIIISDFKGLMKINNIEIPLKMKNNLILLNIKRFKFNSFLYSNEFKAFLKGIKENNLLNITGKIENFNLKLIRKEFLYPLKGRVDFDFKFDNQSKILSFSSEFFNGYSDEKTINLQINMILKRFFKLLNLPLLLKGNISGNIIIDKKFGNFSLLIQNGYFNLNPIIKKLDFITGLRLEKLKSVFFLNGKFDNKKVVFDFISKNKNYYLYLSKGIYYYDGFYNFNIEIRTATDIYKINIANNQIKIIKHLYIKKSNETLVY